MTTTDYAHIPAPVDATEVTEWDRIFAVNVVQHRFFYGTGLLADEVTQ
jgi:hypothetical protein